MGSISMSFSYTLRTFLTATFAEATNIYSNQLDIRTAAP